MKNLLAQKFEVKDLGRLRYFGGLGLLDQKMNHYFSKEVYSRFLERKWYDRLQASRITC